MLTKNKKDVNIIRLVKINPSKFQKKIKERTSLKEQEIQSLNNQIKNADTAKNTNMLIQRDFENFKVNSNKITSDLMSQNNELKQQVSDLMQQVNEIPQLKREIERLKIINDTQDKDKQLLLGENNKCKQALIQGKKGYDELLIKYHNVEKKLNSDPYFAKEIMSRTLYNFAFRIMSEK